jgi:hypothetical protein
VGAHPVGGAVDPDDDAPVQQSVQGGRGYLTTAFGVSMTSMTARRVFITERGGQLIFLCP